MSVNLGVLDIGMEVPGLSEVVSGLKQVDTAGEKAAQGATLAQKALHNTGAESSELTALIKVLGSELRTVTGAIRDSADAMTALGRKTDDAGDKAPPAAAKLRGLAQAMQQMGRAGNTAPLDAMARRIQLFTTGLQGAGTKAASLTRLGQMEAALQRQVASGTLTLAQRIRVEEQLRAIESARAASLARETAAQAASNATRTPAAAGAGMLVGLLGGTVAIGWVKRTLNEATTAADAAEAAQRKLGATSRLTGVALGELSQFARKVRDDFSLSEAAAADWTQAAIKMGARAQDTARSGAFLSAWLDLSASQGLTAADAMQALQTTLIGQDEGLNRLGLSNPQQIYEKWAKSAGTTAAKMSEVQKAQAVMNEIITVGSRVQGEYAKRLETAAGAQERFQREVEQTQANFGRMLSSVRAEAYSALQVAARWIGANREVVIGLAATVVALGVAAAAWAAFAAVAAAATVIGGPVMIGLAALAAIVGGLAAQWVSAKAKAAEYFAAVKAASAEDLKTETARLQAELDAQMKQRDKVGARLASPQDPRNGIARNYLDRKADERSFAEWGKRVDESRAKLEAVLDQRAALINQGDLTNILAGDAGAGTGTAGGVKKTDELIDALSELADLRALSADEQRIALDVEARAVAQRDALAAVTRKTTAQVVALAEAEERLAAIQSVTGRRTGADVSTAVTGARAPRRGQGFDSLDPSRQSAAVKAPTGMAKLDDPFEPNAAQMIMIEQLATDARQFEGLRDGLAVGIAGALTDGIAAGFEQAAASGSIGKGFQALTGTLLGGLGRSMMEFGKASLITATLMDKIKTSLAGFLPGGAVVASLAMIAAGGILAGAASSAFGGGRAGSGGSFSQPAWNDSSSTIALGGRGAATPAAVLPGGAAGAGAGMGAGAAAPAPTIQIGSLFALDPHDGQWQRVIADTVQAAYNRNIVPMPRGGFRT